MAGAGRKDWTPGAQVAANDVDTYLMEQTVMQFATSAARDTALASILDEGLLSSQADSNCLTAYSGAAWSTTGPLWGALTSWTPTVTQSGAVTFTNTQSRYTRTGRWIQGQSRMIVTGGAAVGGNNVVISGLPATASLNDDVIGTAFIYDSSATTIYTALAVLSSTTTVTFRDTTTVGGGQLGSLVFTAALAVNDLISFNFSYEAASDA